MTFMVDVVNQIRGVMNLILTDRNLHVQRKLWEENVITDEGLWL